MSVKEWTLEDWERWIDNNFVRINGDEAVILVNDLIALIEEEVTI